jgi:hypothetical protein
VSQTARQQTVIADPQQTTRKIRIRRSAARIASKIGLTDDSGDAFTGTDRIAGPAM